MPLPTVLHNVVYVQNAYMIHTDIVRLPCIWLHRLKSCRTRLATILCILDFVNKYLMYLAVLSCPNPEISCKRLRACWSLYLIPTRHPVFKNVGFFFQRVRLQCMTRCNSHGISVCLSVTFRCFVHRNEDTIMRSSASASTIILVSGELRFIRTFVGITPSEGVKVKSSTVRSENLTHNEP